MFDRVGKRGVTHDIYKYSKLWKEEKIQDNVEVQIHSIYNHNDRSYYSSFRSSFRTERFTRHNTA